MTGIAQIGVLDEQGVVSVWSVIEMTGVHGLEQDLNMNLGGSFKMVMNYTDNLLLYPNVIDYTTFDDITASIQLEFDPTDPETFFFSTSEGLFKIDKKQKNSSPVKMDTIGLNSPTALSCSDAFVSERTQRGYLLAAYSCGSIW